MPTASRLSILGLYNFDNTIFDNMTVPDGMDKDTAIKQIIKDCAGYELAYPNFDFMKDQIGVWSTVRQTKWEKMYETETLAYNPLYNVDAKTVEDRDLTPSNTGYYVGFNSSSEQEVNKNSGIDKGKITTTRTGNIGVTSSQSLLKEQREVSDFSTYYIISSDFKEEFCLLVY